LLLIALSSLGACTGTPSGPIDLEKSRYARPAHSADHDPWGTLAVRFVRDTRPGWELGFHNYLRESYYSDELFELPVAVTIKRLILVESQRSRVFLPEQERTRSKYLLDLTLNHFFIRTDRNLLDLIPILPTALIDAVIDFEVRLVDQDGRLFLSKRYNSAAEDRAKQFESLPNDGVEQLLQILSALMGELIADMDRSVSDFWAELGMPVQ
jgi:hypothetical protein